MPQLAYPDADALLRAQSTEMQRTLDKGGIVHYMGRDNSNLNHTEFLSKLSRYLKGRFTARATRLNGSIIITLTKIV